ncbi:HlyD family secretion protein [Undibacterium oligocarboniphilum]|uniref:HlyD family efflux transporter periplasmic adaptor subunit n=1 Tax=Undibacterium oligocarboniphilum TaxID=666702 RepID=A0A850QKF5_9BURK|nr:HlyD family efflux transporter periplasmic adaptor subunit [Undibacterium oligocarboniphilum]MBC3868666.1 HlyD family efflux transporter periplasmic adaptor subunit [Undibacterium oligocarboniphilum]NVO76646.1 HlyD family efflux transporter periplasmic adaptor subunit [Undibacterium oligocarboniphilum]
MNAPVQNSTPSTPNEPASDNSKRRGLLLIVSGIILLAGIAYGAWWALVARNYEHTDDAYAAGNVIQVTPQIAGTVVAIHADDTDLVQSGKPLIDLDKTDAKVALEQAEAQLAQTVREVRVLFANNASLQANIDVRNSDVERAKSDLARRQQLLSTGAISAEELEHAKNALKTAEAAQLAAREQLGANRALTDNTSVSQHPNVLRAAAKLREAMLAYSRASLPAPATGYVAKRAVQVGQRVAPGAPLLSIVPLNSLWVDANFKEVQLAHMRIGQDVTLHADLYGSDVEYHGKIVGLSAGTGAAFALLPAQNASGNWIKVVQRVPVRISLDPKELESHPLRIGVSMQVQVNISQQQGAPVTASQPARVTPAYQTQVFEQAAKDADQRIAQIIQINLSNAQNSTPATVKNTADTKAK